MSDTNLDLRSITITTKGRPLSGLLHHAEQIGLGKRHLTDLAYMIDNGLIIGYMPPYKKAGVIDSEQMKAELLKLIADDKKTQEKRQPIKQQTLDEFNIARSVSYGVYIKTEPLTDK